METLNGSPGMQLNDLCNQLAEKTMELLALSNTFEQKSRFNEVKAEVKTLQQAIAKLRAEMPGLNDCDQQ
jgi:hypothetical protein